LNGLNEKSHIHLSSPVVGCEEKEGFVEIKLRDGTTDNFDFVVGADGIKSVIRRDFLTGKFPKEVDCIIPINSGTKAYRAVIRREVIEQRSPNHRALRTPLNVSSIFPILSLH
jgi:salicylate hydroxylase